MFWGVISNIVKMVLPFIVRTILLKLLGEQYLGLNGLFSSVLQVLNLADLGFGTAVVYSMYKPIANDDENTICALLAYFKKVYRIVGTAILGIGICLAPFLEYLISGEIPGDVNIYLIYFIYLGNTVISYWMFAYKGSLLAAHQRNDVSLKISTFLLFIQYGLQIGILFVIKNYYFYLLVLPVVSILTNVATAIATQRLYPQYVCRGQIDSIMQGNIKKQIGGLFLSKVCGTTRNSLDSIFISAFLGLKNVAIYGNYYYILNAVHGLLSVTNTSMLGGIGNSVAKETVEKNYQDFKKFTFLYAWIAGWCSCCMFCLYQHFMDIWVGSELTFSFDIMLLFCVYFFFLTMTDIKNTYTDACGLWWENRTRSILETVVNLVLNIGLGYLFGVRGVLWATLITIIGINIIYGTKILFRYYFVNRSFIRQLIRYTVYFVMAVIVSVITYGVCMIIPNTGFIWLLAKGIVCVVLPNLLFYIMYCRTKIFLDSKPMIHKVLLSFFKPMNKNKV